MIDRKINLIKLGTMGFADVYSPKKKELIDANIVWVIYNGGVKGTLEDRDIGRINKTFDGPIVTYNLESTLYSFWKVKLRKQNIASDITLEDIMDYLEEIVIKEWLPVKSKMIKGRK